MKNQLLLLVVFLCSAPVLFAQTAPAAPAAPPGGDAAALARGWTLLGQGQAEKASQAAADLLRTSPRSVAVLSLLVEAEIARGGPTAALDAYDRWLERRRMEDGYALRRIALALLREIVRTDPAQRGQALAALKSDGDPTASGSADAPDAATLLPQMSLPGPGRRNVIAALGRTGDPRALMPLTGALKDPDPIVRAAAADALGNLAQPQAVPSLKPLLQDPVFTVRLSAARALHALNDDGGRAFLREAASSQFGAVRVEAARALKNEAGPDWLSTVRTLTADEDPVVRREAAELIAPHDPELASATLKPLLDDPNPAIRQVARESYITALVADLTALKGYLRDQDPSTRVEAAARILQLTRE